MTLKSIPYPIRWRSQLDSTRCTELFATSTSSDRKSTRLNSSHSQISYAVFCLKKKKHQNFAHFVSFMTDSYGLCKYDRFSQALDMTLDFSACDMFLTSESVACVSCPSENMLT